MNKKSRFRFAVIAALAIACCSTFAQSAKEQMNALVRDTQKLGRKAGRITLVWWIPPEYWRVAFAASGIVPAEKAEDMISTIRDVNVFAVVDGRIGPFGAGEFTSAQELQKNVSLSDTQNKPVPLIPEEKQTSATKNMISVTKPMLANTLGEFGKNISLLVFEGKVKDGSRRIDPLKPGSFTVKLEGEEFRWRLPLGSLLPDKICPKCNETFPGDYVFCPFDGTQLVRKPAER